MKITEKAVQKEMRFGDIDPGDCFKIPGSSEVYLKTSERALNNFLDQTLAVNLKDGTPCLIEAGVYIRASDTVTLLSNARIVIEI